MSKTTTKPITSKHDPRRRFTPNWITKQPAVLVKVLGEKCAICGSTENLQVHHIDKNRSNHVLSNLQLLCHKCHMNKHRKKKVKITTMKIETDVKTDLEKVAGEVQAVRGGNVSLSEAIDFLIQFYREHKEA